LAFQVILVHHMSHLRKGVIEYAFFRVDLVPFVDPLRMPSSLLASYLGWTRLTPRFFQCLHAHHPLPVICGLCSVKGVSGSVTGGFCSLIDLSSRPDLVFFSMLYPFHPFHPFLFGSVNAPPPSLDIFSSLGCTPNTKRFSPSGRCSLVNPPIFFVLFECARPGLTP